MIHSSDNKKHLRRIGHGLSPVVTVSSKGISESVSAEIDRALEDHELIKVKISVGDRGDRAHLIEEICESCRATLVQAIGHIALLYRPADKPNPRLSNLLR